MLAVVVSDVRYALRQLGRSPGFAVVAILALGLGIGANTAIFSAADALLLSPLPYRDAHELVAVWEDASHVGFPKNTPAPANYVDWRKQNQVFTDMAALRNTGLNLTDGHSAEMVMGARATPNLFSVLGVYPIHGRVWSEQEERDDARVVVLGYGLWQRRFGGDPGIVGRTIQANGEGTTVIGVMPAGFAYPNRDREFYMPSGLNAQGWARRGSHFLTVIGRLKPGVSVAQASGEMDTIGQRLQKQYPDTNTHVGVRIVPLREELLGDTRPQLLILLAAAGCVLLISCANVGNLLLARATVRRREMAVRAALGAGAGRLARQNLTESATLAFAGGLLGLTLAALSLRGINLLVPEDFIGAAKVSLNWVVLGATLALSLLTGLAFGMVPALANRKPDIQDTLRQGDRGAAGFRRNKLRSGLVAAEIAISLILLVTTGLLLQTLWHLRGQDAGFRTDHLLALRTSLAQPRYRETVPRLSFMETAVQRLEALPGVQRAAFVSTLPFESIGNTNSFRIEGRPPLPPGHDQDSMMRVATPGYLELLGVKLKEGRLFDSSDRADSPPSVVINEFFARNLWPNESPLGKRIRFGAENTPWTTVIGVIADVRERGFERPAKFGAYMLQSQNPGWSVSSILLRTSVEPGSVTTPVRALLHELDPELPLTRIRTMEEIMNRQLSSRDRQIGLLAAFALLALLLAAIGLYGVLSYVVAQRTREIGIRMALGAGFNDIVGDVVRHGAALAILGIASGTVLSLIVARTFQALLYGVKTSDPVTYAGVALALLMITLLACIVPASRAAAVDPLIALREE